MSREHLQQQRQSMSGHFGQSPAGSQSIGSFMSSSQQAGTHGSIERRASEASQSLRAPDLPQQRFIGQGMFGTTVSQDPFTISVFPDRVIESAQNYLPHGSPRGHTNQYTSQTRLLRYVGDPNKGGMTVIRRNDREVEVVAGWVRPGPQDIMLPPLIAAARPTMPVQMIHSQDTLRASIQQASPQPAPSQFPSRRSRPQQSPSPRYAPYTILPAHSVLPDTLPSSSTPRQVPKSLAAQAKSPSPRLTLQRLPSLRSVVSHSPMSRSTAQSLPVSPSIPQSVCSSPPSQQGATRSGSIPAMTSRTRRRRRRSQQVRSDEVAIQVSTELSPRDSSPMTILRTASLARPSDTNSRVYSPSHDVSSQIIPSLQVDGEAWTTYRVDETGTRISKTIAPPQGSYKATRNINNTDYSDPRDFFAPTEIEQQDVWNALGPSRAAYKELTNIDLRFEDMKSLFLGYNASYNEIKRKLTQWIFTNFSPDHTASQSTSTMTLKSVPVPALLGYSVPEVTFTSSQPKPPNPLDLKYFVNEQLAVKVDEYLPKLARWNGLIADYEYAPNWPYPRKANALGILIQNPDAFACLRCRIGGVFCWGSGERIGRRCVPCGRFRVQCSNEELITENVKI